MKKVAIIGVGQSVFMVKFPGSIRELVFPAYKEALEYACMAKYGTTLEDLSAIRVKAATYGQINDRAVYRKAVSMEMFARKLKGA